MPSFTVLGVGRARYQQRLFAVVLSETAPRVVLTMVEDALEAAKFVESYPEVAAIVVDVAACDDNVFEELAIYPEIQRLPIVVAVHDEEKAAHASGFGAIPVVIPRGNALGLVDEILRVCSEGGTA